MVEIADDEGECPEIEMNFLGAGERNLRMRKPGERSHGEQQAEDAAGDGEDERFREVFADETPAAAAERSADGEIFLPCGGAGDEQVGDVEAGDEQDADGSGEQCVERRFEVFDRGVEERAADGAAVDRGCGMRELDVALHGIDLADETSEGGAGREARDDEEFVIVEDIHESRELREQRRSRAGSSG